VTLPAVKRIRAVSEKVRANSEKVCPSATWRSLAISKVLLPTRCASDYLSTDNYLSGCLRNAAIPRREGDHLLEASLRRPPQPAVDPSPAHSRPLVERAPQTRADSGCG